MTSRILRDLTKIFTLFLSSLDMHDKRPDLLIIKNIVSYSDPWAYDNCKHIYSTWLIKALARKYCKFNAYKPKAI